MMGQAELETSDLLHEMFAGRDVRVVVPAQGPLPRFWMWKQTHHESTSLLVLHDELGKDALAYLKSLPIVSIGRLPSGVLDIIGMLRVGG